MPPSCAALAERLGLTILPEDQSLEAGSLCLYWKEDVLSLGRAGSREYPVAVDFVRALQQRRQGPELLIKAVTGNLSVKLAVIDATAGLGRDSAILLGRGLAVTMVEQNPVVAALLENAIDRLKLQDAEAAGRLSLNSADAADYLAQHRADVVYLDPMFAASGKSALAKKDMQLFQHLLGHGDEDSRLLDAALASAEYRVVVKRALKAPPLAGREPGVAIKGKAVRFDVYPLKSLKQLNA
ncbi:16S rRNA (guanine1516-N2)-methyltransferase [Litorivivens lipolytica]|uniref:Ribosomal RNA small subunit methyltransferase J n=1 Tax=Litorivivens lipolytica TaxID=1524264 RepID=A0A7W4Z6C9_9GAMM|nr:16S rRNA (guanine1516-N2)-methyltransferase [Litorivivens lipolytica]